MRLLQPTAKHAVTAALCTLGLICTATPAHARPPAATAPSVPIYLDTGYSFQERAADLVSRMSLDEKAQQLRTNSAPAIPRLGVQQYTYWSEGQHGINTLFANTNPGSVTGGVHATSFPTNFAASMSWDKDLVYRETTAVSDEARGLLDKSLWGTGQNNLGPSRDDYGMLTYWAPTVNLDRDPRWGRTDEAFGEDPYLAGQMAGAFVNGYQGQNPDGTPQGKYLKVAATAKHYALNDVEQDRTGISSDVSDDDLFDYYTAQFKSLIEKAHVAGLMTSYNAINGTPSVANTYTTNQIAQRTFGFGGYITSDCGAVGTTYQGFPAGHDWAPPGWTTDRKGASATWTETATGQQLSGAAGGQAYALRAGTNVNCTGAEATSLDIGQAIAAGVLSEGVVDNALVHLFTVRMRTGEFDPVDKQPYTKITKAAIESPAHQDLARTVADNALVLLQNDKPGGAGKPLLPADPAALDKVVIVGDQAGKVTLGGYSGDPTKKVDAVQGITAQVTAANPDAQVVYDAAGTSTTATGAAVLGDKTRADIRDADLVVIAVGTDEATAGEGKDRSGLALPGNYGSLIDQVAALGNPRTVLDIQSDGPVAVEAYRSEVAAVVFAGYNGESQGDALADVLFGRQNPGGHLNFTWYKDDSQLPAISDYDLAPSGTGGLGRTYQYFTGTPTYPFGYGLSYSTFAYSHVRADRRSVDADGTVAVGFDVTNTGSVPGTTVAQLYAAADFTVKGRELPDKRLAGFQKTRVLQPGATQHITLRVRVPDLAFHDGRQAKQVVYDGRYRFEVGPDSATTAGSARVTVHGSLTPHVAYVTVQPESVVYDAGQTIDLTGRNRWIKDDTDPAAQPGRNLAVTADHVVQAANDDGSFVDLSRTPVRYTSSDPSVATVSPRGVVTTVGNGVATISATVHGVTGSAVIRVHHTLAVSAARIVTPGVPVTATTTYTNTGPTALPDASITLSAPAGWTVTATSPATFREVAAGASVTTTWSVTPPADTAPGSYALAASATYRGARAGDDAVGQLLVPYSSVGELITNVGISDDAEPGSGNLDGGGQSLSQQALAAQGIASGGTVAHDGLTFTWPATGTGKPDNIVASGQTVPFTGGGSTIGFLGTADYGNASGTGTITYTDGTTQDFTLSFPDWWANSPSAGNDVLATTDYFNNGGGKVQQKVSVYAATAPLQAGKTIAYLTLPNVGPDAATNQVALHIFAIAVG
ncbi:glycoside hydrolase family 3 C-terminal domain-containing protein [Actinacidiphila bryophytorum]|uniref:Beta-glucosidase n=2 Tax=Actinacidiphila bryophytorum TaxID=1436133 RepID=A0A9W4E3A0_9ACTN|nr:glycoside hydrolase family 3 C-terminal domain-containing protein [Actinacidiphila bryophytorum]MBM9440747.1 glycoside hydrolase family 3 C-terminal domain-containing protein [Actinacidiphila bryophytorum]CAG7612821.1 Beta-glucosidase [Actinacidiphila bryophytorum]